MTRRIAGAALLLAASLTLPAQQASEKPLHVVTYVDVYPNFAAEAAKMLDQFAADSRKQAGSVRFDVLRDVARPNHMAIVEVWQTRASYEAHLTAEFVKRFRERLQPMLGSPFDERLYNSLP